METAAIVLSVDQAQTKEFEAGFREHELPTWVDFRERGVLIGASLQRMDISSQPRSGAQQYLVVAIFATDEGHHLHDSDPRFRKWDQIADSFQVAPAMAFGGETILEVGLS